MEMTDERKEVCAREVCSGFVQKASAGQVGSTVRRVAERQGARKGVETAVADATTCIIIRRQVRRMIVL